LIYTSGTTGKPKGVVRSHESHVAFYLLNVADSGFTNHDICLNVMPLCHINSTFYTFTFLYVGGTAYIHPARSFKAEEILEIIEREKITFISLIPTHFRGEWFSAGDLGRRDEDGYYQIVDRKDNMIITGAEHAYPSEVEEVIGSHPAVFDTAVIGVPDE
jgi:acyl-CoA synthetase (AMP-forming)/AMP-acid ligase II